MTILGLLLLAFALRTTALQSRPLWYDEAFSFLLSQTGWQGIISGTIGSGAAAAEPHPLLYPLALSGWLDLLGPTIFSARLFSSFAGFLSVALAGRLAHDLFGRGRAVFVAILLLTFSPFQIHYAQEIRLYALLAMWLLAAAWAYLRALRAKTWHWWAAFTLLAALAQYTNVLASLLLIPLALTPLILRRRREVRNTLLAGFAALVLYSPWLVVFPRQVAKLDQGFWILRPGPAELVRTLLVFNFNLPLPGGLAGLGAGLFVVVFAAILTLRTIILGWKNAAQEAQPALWLFYLSAASLGLMYAISQYFPIYVERAVLASGALYMIALSWSFSKTQRAPALLLGLLFGVVTLGGIWTHFTYAGFPYAPYAQLANRLAEEAEADSVIVHSNKLTYLPTIAYDGQLRQQFVADLPGSGSDNFALPSQQALGLYAVSDLVTAVGDAPRVWFVIFDQAIKEYQAIGEATHPHLVWLAEHYTLDRVHHYDDLSLYEFVFP